MGQLIYYNSTEVLYFEINTMDESWPQYKVVIDFILNYGGVF